MLRRIRNIATGFSVALLAATIALAIAADWISPWQHRLSISDEFHVGVWTGFDSDIRLVFFNDCEYGPYCGSIISIDGYPPRVEEHLFGDTAGIYYRYFRWPDATLWTLMLSLWYPAIFFAILPTWSCIQWRRISARQGRIATEAMQESADCAD